MPRSERAKQFAPFDALKGLQNALRIKEYQHEKKAKGDLLDDEIENISNEMLKFQKGDKVFVEFFDDGYYKQTEGVAIIDFENQKIEINDLKIDFDNIFKFVIK